MKDNVNEKLGKALLLDLASHFAFPTVGDTSPAVSVAIPQLLSLKHLLGFSTLVYDHVFCLFVCLFSVKMKNVWQM